jgi:hypothetical protein
MLSAYVAVRILQINFAQISLTSISLYVFSHLLHVMVIDISTKCDPTLKADTSMPALHENGIGSHVTANQTLGLLIIFVETPLLTFDGIIL